MAGRSVRAPFATEAGSVCEDRKSRHLQTILPTLLGSHLQGRTGRTYRYWVQYGPLSDEEAFFICVVSEPGRGLFGSLERGASYEGTVPAGLACVPVALAIQSRVLSYIERTDFGDWRPPPPSWPGWYGQML